MNNLIIPKNPWKFIPGATSCCYKKVITAPNQYVGTYTLSKDVGGPPDPNCFDGCIYSKEGSPSEEYCFSVSVPGADIEDQCDATLPPPTDGSTATAGSTTEGPTTTAAPTTTAVSLKSTVDESIEDAQTSLDTINDLLDDDTLSDDLKTSLSEVQSTITDLISSLSSYSTDLSRRRLRRAVETLGKFCMDTYY